MTEIGPRFAFGENWQSFVSTAVNTKRIAKAANSLRRMLNVDDLRGRVFLDVGCGSGLFSLAACLLGAERVIAFDYDPASVQASIALRGRANLATERWQILQGSILDAAFLDRIDSADVVYSWGVLHHTGDMWTAIDNAVSKVTPGGLLALAIYNHVERGLNSSAIWWQIKRTYNASPQPVRRVIEAGYVAAFMLQQAMSCVIRSGRS